MPGILLIRSRIEPIFFIVADLLAEIVEVELSLGELLLLAESLFLVHRPLGRLDQADDVAHAEHLADEPLGIERLELVELLTLADKLDRHAGDPADRQCGPAASVAVELGQDHAVELERLVEGLGRSDRVLARSSRRRRRRPGAA